MDTFWRHNLWEQIKHVSANFLQFTGEVLLDKGTPIFLKTLRHSLPLSGFF